MNSNSFLEFLQGRHAKQYQGLDDQMPDDFEDWLQDQDPYDLIEYAEIWKDKIISLQTPK